MPKPSSKSKARSFVPEEAGNFVCIFVDGPWGGSRVTYKRDVPKFEVGRPRRPEENGDCFFRYEPVSVAEQFGVKETTYKLTYDGPQFIGGKHA